MNTDTIRVRPLATSDAGSCDAVIAGLPQFFGQPEGVRDCAAAVRKQRGLVAEHGSVVVGFLTFVCHHEVSAEITWMAVHARNRHRSTGKRLLAALERSLAEDGIQLLSVKTLSPNSNDGTGEDVYGPTRRFYESCGFAALMDVPELWPNDVAMIMVKPLS